MKKIIVDNFEMIGHQELTLDTNLNILIGPQASGKSTLVKLIFFCRKLRDFLLDYLSNPRNFPSRPHHNTTNLHNYLRRQFMGYFDITNKFKVRFYVDFEKGQYVSLTLDDTGYPHIMFESTMWFLISKYLRQAREVFSYGDFGQYVKTKNSAREYFKPMLDDLFHDKEELIYIPAGRGVFSIFSDEQLWALFSQENDTEKVTVNNNSLFQDFLYRIRDMKKQFNMSLSEIILNYRKTGTSYSLNESAAKQAISIIDGILGAKYRVDKEGEKLYYTDDKYVKLMFASSGQQEVLWILNLIFLKILEKRRIFLVLEEPEAHLFPKAQKGVVDLIALLIHSTGSSVFITTHSPYILTSVNLCVYSAQVENNPKLPRKRPDSVVPPHLRIPPEKYNAFMTPERKARSEKAEFLECIKEEDGLIDATKIDGISNDLIDDTNRLIDLEVQYDL